jgi:transposase
MSDDKLREEYERLKAEAAELEKQAALLRQQSTELRNRTVDLQDESTRLGEEKARLEGEKNRLELENLELRRKLEESRQRLAEAEAQIAELKRELFGPKSDRLTPEQQEQLSKLHEDLEAEARRPAAASDGVLDEEEKDKKKEKQRRAVRRRHPLPVHLETETVTIEVQLAPCPCCGRMPERIGEEVSEEIDLIPARLIRRRTVRPRYACRCGEAGVVIAPLPARLIPQSRLGLGLAVHVVLARYDDHLSFYRLEQQFQERHRVLIPRQQMVQWTEHIATWLLPVYEAMWKVMVAGGYLQIDETPVKVLDPEVEGKAARGYLWFYAVPGGDVILEFDRSRGLAPVQKRLQGFVGTIQTDAYEVYQSLERKESHIERIACTAHARRYFYKAVLENLVEAVWFIGQIRSLYRIENEIRGLLPEERYSRRLEQSPGIWVAMRARAEELKPKLLPRSTLGKAVNYFLNEYDALVGYLRDGRYEIDNNLVENSIRPTAVGRKRWLFVGHPDAGWRSAVIYSILVSCRRRGINPQEYLTAVLGRLPRAKTSDIKDLIPANWKPPSVDTS